MVVGEHGILSKNENQGNNSGPIQAKTAAVWESRPTYTKYSKHGVNIVVKIGVNIVQT